MHGLATQAWYRQGTMLDNLAFQCTYYQRRNAASYGSRRKKAAQLARALGLDDTS